MASVTVYHISDISDRARELLRFVGRCAGGDPDAFVATHEPALAAREFGSIVDAAMKHQDVIIRAASEEEAEGAFSLIFSFMSDLSVQQQKDIIERAATTLVSVTDGKTAILRLRILANLFNIVATSSEKLSLLSRIIRFAGETRAVDQLAPFLAATGHLAAMEKLPGVTAAHMRPLYAQLSAALERSGDADVAQVYLIRFLMTFEGDAPAAASAEAKDGAKKAAIGYIKAPAISQRSNLPNLEAVKAMKSDPAYASVHALLQIFASGDLDAYTAFHAEHAGFVDSLGVDHAASMETMRLLTLCSLAAGKRSLTFGEVATALKVAEADVESWIVRAIARGLMDARMDQLSGTVTVTRTTVRNFSAPQWTALSAQLHAWRDNIAQLLTKMEV